jgi:photosystem II stability/assembly factor-like uncharacterized protein
VRVLLALAFVLAFVASGCLSPSAVTTKSTPAGMKSLAVVGPDVSSTTSPATRQANELSVAVNPLDPNNIIATGKDYTPDQAGDCVWAGIYATKDGGKTWKDQNVPGSPWHRQQSPTDPLTPFSSFFCVTDPVVRFGPDGTAYWVVQPYQCDPLSGSKTGRGVLPMGGMNDWAYTCSAMYVLVSTDGGLTWPLDKARELGTGAGGLPHDKPWIDVAPDNSKVLVCWDYGGPESTTSDPTAPYTPADGNGVVCTVSTDKGASWSRFALATDKGGFPWLDFDGTSRAWMAIAGADKIYVLSSTDGVKWSDPVAVGSFKVPSSTQEYGWPVLDGSAFRIVPYGAIGVDKSTGPHANRVYVAWFDHSTGKGVILTSWSDDGKTWSPPHVVSDLGGKADQFLPALSVGPDGTVDVSWLDRRDDPNNHLYTAYYAYSLDGGQTFSDAVRVGTQLSDERYSHHQNGMIFLGDYRDMGSVKGAASMTWVDTRNQKADAFVATVLRPSANAG